MSPNNLKIYAELLVKAAELEKMKAANLIDEANGVHPTYEGNVFLWFQDQVRDLKSKIRLD